MSFTLKIMRSICSFSLSIFLVGVLSLLVSFTTNAQPGYAEVSTPKQALQEIEKDQASENPTQAYEGMTKVVEDPKVGIEKEYEKNEQKYFSEHPESESLVEKAKELVNKVTEPKGQ
jgi:esterase/lipase